jgi:hypothetical protein
MTEMDTNRLSTFTLFLVSVACTVLLSGCFGEELVGPYEGPDKIAFAFDLVADAQASGEPASMTVTEPATVTLGTELIGEQRSSDTEVMLATANETVNYVKEVPTDTGSVQRDTTVLARATTAPDASFNLPESYTLPSDSSSASFQVEINDNLPSGGEPVRVAIRLDGNSNSNLEAAETMRYFTINILPN